MVHRPLSFVRSPFAPSRVASGTLGLLLAGSLLTACGQPRPVEPPAPPPVAEAEPELYGAPGDPAPEAYADAEPSTDPTMPGEPDPDTAPGQMADARRPGWGTMEPVPNPPGSPSAPASDRALAQAEPSRAPSPAPSNEGPSIADRVEAYRTGPAVPPPEVYAQRYAAQTAPPPAAQPVEPPMVDAPFAEGQPASSTPSTIVTMPPVPNPVEARPAPRMRDAVEPRRERRTARQTMRPADDSLLGGPDRPRAQSRRSETPARVAASSARPGAAAAVRTDARSRSAAATTARRPDARKNRPAASTPAGRQAALDGLRSTLTTLVERDSTLALDPAKVDEEQRVTLSLPASLGETLTREAKAGGLGALASRAEVRALLRGDGWRVEPEEPQTGPLAAGQTSSFTWGATPSRGAGPLTADVSTTLSGGGRFETLDLGEVRREVEGAGEARGLGGGLNGVPGRAIGLAVLLLLAVLGALFFFGRGGESDGSRRRFNRRRPDPVNLTPYSPAADTDAPRAPSDPDPKPA